MYKLKCVPEDFIVDEIFTPPQNGGDHLIILLSKRDTELLSAIDALAEKLAIKPRAIGYAGIKDKRAVTTQYLSIRGVPKMELERRGFSLVGSDSKALSLGDHQGNRFKITVRNLSSKDLQRMQKRIQERIQEKKNEQGDYTFLNLLLIMP